MQIIVSERNKSNQCNSNLIELLGICPHFPLANCSNNVARGLHPPTHTHTPPLGMPKYLGLGAQAHVIWECQEEGRFHRKTKSGTGWRVLGDVVGRVRLTQVSTIMKNMLCDDRPFAAPTTTCWHLRESNSSYPPPSIPAILGPSFFYFISFYFIHGICSDQRYAGTKGDWTRHK